MSSLSFLKGDASSVDVVRCIRELAVARDPIDALAAGEGFDDLVGKGARHGVLLRESSSALSVFGPPLMMAAPSMATRVPSLG